LFRPRLTTCSSIPKRRELVKEAARAQTASEVKESQQEQHSHRWTTCALSQKPLQAPVVSDYMGMLYNKDAILEYLLPADDAAAQTAKADAAKVLGGRVAGLKDVLEVKFQDDGEAENGNAGLANGTTWVCPITNKQLGPGVKAAYIVPCGHAFSEIALKEVAELVCLQVCLLTCKTLHFLTCRFSATSHTRRAISSPFSLRKTKTRRVFRSATRLSKPRASRIH
jgi:Rtf2 RING-finger